MLIQDVLVDWSKFKRGLEAESYEPVEAEVAEAKFEIVQASRWSAEHDESRSYVEVKSTDVDRKPGRFLHLVRDTGASVLVTKRGEPFVVLVPGKDWAEYLSASVGVTLDALGKAIRRGPMKLVIGGNPKALQQKLEREKPIRDHLESQLRLKELELAQAKTDAANARSNTMGLSYEVQRLTNERDDIQRRVLEEKAARQVFEKA